MRISCSDLADLVEVKGIYSSSRHPERLIFVYRNSNDVIWPLYMIFQEGFSTLTKICGVMKRTLGFTPFTKQIILKRILEIRKEWASNTSLPRMLKIPFTGKKFIMNLTWWCSSKIKKVVGDSSELKIDSRRLVLKPWRFCSLILIRKIVMKLGCTESSKSKLRSMNKNLEQEEDLQGTSELLRLEEQSQLYNFLIFCISVFIYVFCCH